MKSQSKQPPCGRSDACFLCHHLSNMWTRIKERSFELDCDPHQDIFDEGESVDQLFAVCRGAVLLYSRLSDGSMKVHWIARAGELLAMAAALLNRPYMYSAKTLEHSTLSVIKRSAFLAALEAEPALWKPISLEIARRHYDTLAEGKKSSLVKLAELLLAFSPVVPDAKAKPPSARVRMTAQTLADSVGVSERMVWNYLARLSGKELIGRKEGCLVVRHPEGLRKYLEEIQSGKGKPSRKKRAAALVMD